LSPVSDTCQAVLAVSRQGMPCLTHWHIWLCHMEVGRTLVLSPSTYKYYRLDCPKKLIAYQVTSDVWRLTGRLPSRLLQHVTLAFWCHCAHKYQIPNGLTLMRPFGIWYLVFGAQGAAVLMGIILARRSRSCPPTSHNVDTHERCISESLVHRSLGGFIPGWCCHWLPFAVQALVPYC
jgi:hypothetical protein